MKTDLIAAKQATIDKAQAEVDRLEKSLATAKDSLTIAKHLWAGAVLDTFEEGTSLLVKTSIGDDVTWLTGNVVKITDTSAGTRYTIRWADIDQPHIYFSGMLMERLADGVLKVA